MHDVRAYTDLRIVSLCIAAHRKASTGIIVIPVAMPVRTDQLFGIHFLPPGPLLTAGNGTRRFLEVSIPQETADRILARCGRCCCICRRFAPLHLQVHHIIEKGDSGTDDEDNLIATCLTCHSDVHTNTKLTRRFSREELKLHRQNVYGLVAEGKLPGGPAVPDADSKALEAIVRSLNITPTDPQPMGQTAGAPFPETVEILLHAVRSDGYVATDAIDNGMLIQAGDFQKVTEGRERAKYKRGLDELLSLRWIEYEAGILYTVTEDGYQAADALLAAGSQTGEKENKSEGQ
jgi:hypothetical protein